MPRGNRTGPQGVGPMTGRAAGYCAGYDAPGYMQPNPGWGFGMGDGGRGRGRRHRHLYFASGLPRWARQRPMQDWDAPPGYGPYAPLVTREQQAQALEGQAAMLREQLTDLEEGIAALRTDPGAGAESQDE